MSVEISGSGMAPEPLKIESREALADLEQTMEAVRDAVRTGNTERSEQVSLDNELTAADIAEAAEAFATLAHNLNRDLRFNVDNDLEKPIIRVIDRSSGEMIRQIPSEEFVDLAVKLRELNSEQHYDSATGFLIDSKV